MYQQVKVNLVCADPMFEKIKYQMYEQ